VPLTVNRGTPIVLSDPRNEFARSITAMAKSLIAPMPQQAVAKKRLLPLGR
jgi:hypothetical protein